MLCQKFNDTLNFTKNCFSYSCRHTTPIRAFSQPTKKVMLLIYQHNLEPLLFFSFSLDNVIFHFFFHRKKKKPTAPSTTDSAVGFINSPTLPASLLRSVLTMYTYSPDQTAAGRNSRAGTFHSAVPYGSR